MQNSDITRKHCLMFNKSFILVNTNVILMQQANDNSIVSEQ